MPKFDGSGPEGKGPMTGRGSGYCVIPLNTTEQELEFLKKSGTSFETAIEAHSNQNQESEFTGSSRKE